MQLGMVGLGRMGANLVRRLMRAGHECVVYDVTPAAVAELSLDPGSQVWLTVKATDLEVYPHNGAPTELTSRATPTHAPPAQVLDVGQVKFAGQ